MSGHRSYARPLEGADRITARAEADELLIEADKVVRSTDPYLAGHFPQVTLYPAIFLLDGIRQVVGAELHRAPSLAAHLDPGSPDEPDTREGPDRRPEGPDRRPGGPGDDWLELGTLDSARVLKPMLEGDELRLLIRVSAGRPGALRAALDCRRADGTQVAKMTVELVRGGSS
nr:Pep24 [Streptomyces sp. NAK02211]